MRDRDHDPAGERDGEEEAHHGPSLLEPSAEPATPTADALRMLGIEQIRAGDVVVTPADVWHWHGAAADHYMTHLSITESPGDGRPDAEWGEHVTDEEAAG